jgi:hypothetical protein
MADIDMTDAPPAKAAASKASKSSGDDKKRFEVKKVPFFAYAFTVIAY